MQSWSTRAAVRRGPWLDHRMIFMEAAMPTGVLRRPHTPSTVDPEVNLVGIATQVMCVGCKVGVHKLL
eukprot:4891616-Amphidinium_carterae.1